MGRRLTAQFDGRPRFCTAHLQQPDRSAHLLQRGVQALDHQPGRGRALQGGAPRIPAPEDVATAHQRQPPTPVH